MPTPSARAPRRLPSRQDAERETLRAALATHRGSREDPARTLGVSLRTLYRKLRELEAR